MAADRDDPDALWKPGYQGGYRTPERGSDSTTSAPPRRRPVVAGTALAAFALVVVTGAIAIGVLRSDRAPAPATEIEPGSWSVTFDTTRLGALTATPDVLVVVVGRPGEVVALDRSDGAERWRRSAPGASATGLDVVDDAVLVRHVEADGRGSIASFDVTTGVPLWERPLAVGERVDVFGEQVVRRDPSDAERLDPRSGDRLPAGASGTADDPTDHVVRALAANERRVIDLADAEVRILLDATTASVTVEHVAVVLSDR